MLDEVIQKIPTVSFDKMEEDLNNRIEYMSPEKVQEYIDKFETLP